jgi:hypothetical protein
MTDDEKRVVQAIFDTPACPDAATPYGCPWCIAQHLSTEGLIRHDAQQ